MARLYRTNGDSQGAPDTSVYGQSVKRSLHILAGHPRPLVRTDNPEKARVGVVMVQGFGRVIVTQGHKQYTGILPVRQQPQFKRAYPYNDPNRGRA